MASTIFNNLLQSFIDMCSTVNKVTGANGQDTIEYIKIGRIVVFNAQMYYGTQSDRIYDIPSAKAIVCGCRNTSTGAIGQVWMNGTTISTYGGGVSWQSGQYIMFGGVYITRS